MALRELHEWCDKLISTGEGFSVVDKELFMADIMAVYDDYEDARQHERKEEAARIETKAEVEAEATKRMAYQRVCSPKPSDSEVGPMVARGASDRNDPIGGIGAAQKTKASIERLLAA